MHVESYQKSSVKNIIKEHDRKAKNYKNEVDPSRSHLNFELVSVGFGDEKLGKDEVYARALSRCRDILGDVRFDKMQSNTNVMSEWNLTYPVELCEKALWDTGKKYDKDVKDKITGNIVHHKGDPVLQEYNKPRDMEHCRRFFSLACEFMMDRYGQDNFLGAYVHMDETTPHMHFDFVPEAISRKTKKKTVSSASLLTRLELSGKKTKKGNGVHYDLQQRMVEEFGDSAKEWILNGRTKGGYTTDELKERTRKEKELEEKIREFEKEKAEFENLVGNRLLDAIRDKYSGKFKEDMINKIASGIVPKKTVVSIIPKVRKKLNRELPTIDTNNKQEVKQYE